MKEKAINNVAFIGECMIALQKDAEGNIRQQFSGDTLNAAVFFARECRETLVSTDYLTAIGTDHLSDEMLAFWQQEGLGCSQVLRIDDKNPGLYFIHLDECSERHFTYWRSNAAARFMFSQPESQLLLDSIRDYDAIYISGITLAILLPDGLDNLRTALTLAKARGAKIWFDSNYRPDLWIDREAAAVAYRNIMPLCDVALITLDDVTALFGTTTPESVIEHWSSSDVHEIIVRHGESPCLISHNGQLMSIPAEPVSEVVDTTAAGDAFSAAYLAARINGQSVEAAAKAGHALAAQIIQTEGVF